MLDLFKLSYVKLFKFIIIQNIVNDSTLYDHNTQDWILIYYARTLYILLEMYRTTYSWKGHGLHKALPPPPFRSTKPSPPKRVGWIMLNQWLFWLRKIQGLREWFLVNLRDFWQNIHSLSPPTNFNSNLFVDDLLVYSWYYYNRLVLFFSSDYYHWLYCVYVTYRIIKLN